MEAGKKIARHTKRVGTAIVGVIVVIVGIILIPYPGPGILIVLGGLAILATEFTWAQDALIAARKKYDDWQAWVKLQSVGVQLSLSLATLAVTVLTLWLLNCYGTLDTWLHLGQPWLHSPFFS